MGHEPLYHALQIWWANVWFLGRFYFSFSLIFYKTIILFALFGYEIGYSQIIGKSNLRVFIGLAIMGYINSSHHLARKYARIFVSGHYLFREAKRSSRKTVSYEEQIMSTYKYLSIFSPQMETIVFIILQIFFATHAVLNIGEERNNSHHLAQKYARIFVHGHCLFREANSFTRAKAIVFIILQIFFAMCAVLKIGEYLTIIPWARVGYEVIK